MKVALAIIFTLFTMILFSNISYSNVFAIEIFLPDSKPYDVPYADWGEKYWKWFLAIPATSHPDNPDSGVSCDAGQKNSSSPVFYLTGGSDGTVKKCNVPQGKSVLIMLSSMEASDKEFPGLSDEELIEAARSDQDQLTSLSMTLDGKNYAMPQLLKYRTLTGIFDVIFGDPPMFGVSDPGPARAVSDNTFVITKPLEAGNHTVGFEGTLGDDVKQGHYNVNYELNVNNTL